MPLLNYIFTQFNVQWYPEVCWNTGKLITSSWTSQGFIWPTYLGPQCTSRAQPVLGLHVEFSAIIPAEAEQVRIAVGVLSYCRFFANCTGASNTTPWFDDLALGVYGHTNAPYITNRDIDLPQDAFPENGTLYPYSPGRIDAGNVKGETSPEMGSSLGDTLIVQGAVGGAEVWVEFAVDPGPAINLNAYQKWLTRPGHVPRGVHRGQAWYAARMDTAEQGGSGPLNGTWMTAYHESSPAFTGNDRSLDPKDPDPNGVYTRLINDIFPDHVFTPGTRVHLFYRSKFVDAPDVPGSWYVTPDTTGGTYVEWECLPSSMARNPETGDYEWNCLLYVDHFDGRGAQGFIENALAALLGPGSENFEGTKWDRWDVRAPSSQQCSFGRPLRSEYGATLIQAMGYTDILWNSGNLNAFTLSREDGDVLVPWLTLDDSVPKGLYLSGDGIVTSPILEGATEPSARYLLENLAGLQLRCQTFRLATCPAGSVVDETPCLDLDPVAGAVVAEPGSRVATHVGQGNGCPQLRSFDVISVGTPVRGVVSGDEAYAGDEKTLAHASAALDAAGLGGTAGYRIVVDGLSLHYRRDGGTPCDFVAGGGNAITERMEEVAAFLGLGGACEDPSTRTGVIDPARPPAYRPSLDDFSPNPLRAGKPGRIRFTLARAGRARIEVFDIRGRRVATVFEGPAEPGANEAFWNGTNAAGEPLGSGVYFYRLTGTGIETAKKMVVVRNGR
jgi:hypothetical protein